MTTKEEILRLFKGLGVAVAATAAVFVTVSPTSASAQQASESVIPGAAACGVTPHNRDTRPYAQFFTQDVNLRNGPAWGCQIVDTAKVTNQVDLWCTTDGFTYVRTASTKYGWVSNLYLSAGNIKPC
ncbi:SH3 domain-containing protein [Streptomyces sp. NPDC029216]|uniref:SH3 domain-containing protein n=1 Tax=Streptomyces sp. NPDC029216 TaxID=3154701 RepID=UPI0033D8D005